MILYELKCSNGHYFEAWFKDSTTYDLQEERGEVACPICSDISVSKAPMAPAVSTSRKKDNRAHQPVPRMENPSAEIAKEFLQAAGKMQKYVEENFKHFKFNRQVVKMKKLSLMFFPHLR